MYCKMQIMASEVVTEEGGGACGRVEMNRSDWL